MELKPIVSSTNPAMPKADYGAALWTVAAIIERLEEAARTIRRMRIVGTRPAGAAAAWPDVVRDASEAYGWTTADEPRLVPGPAAISSADQALGWLLWLSARDRQLVWARANRVKWRKLAARFGKSERCVQLWHRAAILCVVERLAQNPVAISRKRA